MSIENRRQPSQEPPKPPMELTRAAEFSGLIARVPSLEQVAAQAQGEHTYNLVEGSLAIDPESEKVDAEQSFTIEEIDFDIYRVGVHITNPAAAVPFGHPAIQQSFFKGSSSFGPNGEHLDPMMPAPYTYNHLALQEGEGRPTITITYQVNMKASPGDSDFLTHQGLSLSYTRVNKALSLQEASAQIEMPLDAEDETQTDLKDAKRIAEKLSRRPERNATGELWGTDSPAKLIVRELHIAAQETALVFFEQHNLPKAQTGNRHHDQSRLQFTAPVRKALALLNMYTASAYLHGQETPVPEDFIEEFARAQKEVQIHRSYLGNRRRWNEIALDNEVDMSLESVRGALEQMQRYDVNRPDEVIALLRQLVNEGSELPEDIYGLVQDYLDVEDDQLPGMSGLLRELNDKQLEFVEVFGANPEEWRAYRTAATRNEFGNWTEKTFIGFMDRLNELGADNPYVFEAMYRGIHEGELNPVNLLDGLYRGNETEFMIENWSALLASEEVQARLNQPANIRQQPIDRLIKLLHLSTDIPEINNPALETEIVNLVEQATEQQEEIAPDWLVNLILNQALEEKITPAIHTAIQEYIYKYVVGSDTAYSKLIDVIKSDWLDSSVSEDPPTDQEIEDLILRRLDCLSEHFGTTEQVA